jgi:hypothetical protein
MANSSEPLLSLSRFDSCGAGACGEDALLKFIIGVFLIFPASQMV